MKYDCTEETIKHIKTVQEFIGRFNSELKQRGIDHDKSKLSDQEKPYFDEYTPKLKTCTFGSDEYKKYLKELNVALRHHYRHNPHHPEHHWNGINDMSLVDDINEWKNQGSESELTKFESFEELENYFLN